MKAESIDVKMLLNGTSEITFKAKATAEELNKVVMLSTNCDDIDVEFNKHRNRRSLTANGALWLLQRRIAEATGSHPDEVYLQMLQRYSHYFTHVVVKPDAVDDVKQQWRTVVDLGPLEVNGKEGIQLRCYFGSSMMDSKQFSKLLSGVISECKGLGIETLRDGQFDAIMAQYESEENNGIPFK